MPRFTVRVELHEYNGSKPDYDDYERLHVAMQQNGYYRVIKSDEDKWYHMPNATYTAELSKTTAGVREEASGIVKTVWQRAGTFVTKADDSRHWQGLIPASNQDVLKYTA
jgi:hypothetical protein